MTKSSLATDSYPSPNRYWGRAYPVTRVTIHHMAGCLTAEECGNIFSSPSRQASSNYGIGYGGEIACYVDEDDAAWTSASWDNDNRAITIEVSNSWEGVASGSWAISDASWRSMIRLCADICERYGIEPSYTGDTGGSFTEHRMFAPTSCPGPYIHGRMYQIVDEVKKEMEGEVYPGRNVGIYSSNGTAAQKWKLEKSGDFYVIRSMTGDKDKVLDVYGGDAVHGGKVQIFPANGTDAQLWTVMKLGGKWSGYYEVAPKKNPKLRVDIYDGDVSDLNKVWLYESNNTQAQKWLLAENGDGTVTFLSAKAHHPALDVYDGGRPF